jgi:hypothetical protein
MSFKNFKRPVQTPTPSAQLFTTPPVSLEEFRVDYENNVYVLLTIDVNSYNNFFEFPGDYSGNPSWLYDFGLYYNGTRQYSLSDLIGLVFDSQTNYPFNYPNNLIADPGIAFWTSDENVAADFYNLMTINSLDLFDITITNITSYNPICFKEDTKILTDKGYVPIQQLRNGDLVKTLHNDYKPINMIGKRNIYNPAVSDRVPNQLYKCSPSEYPELSEDLILTGPHSILVDKYQSGQKEKTQELLGKNIITDHKYCLPVCLDERATVYESSGLHTIYHLALDNRNVNKNYGIYANGLLTESCSIKYLKEYSNMELL